MSEFREILLCKYGEICLKGANRSFFETLLSRELKYRLQQVGKYRVIKGRSLARIEPEDETSDMDAAYRVAMHTFGIIAVRRKGDRRALPHSGGVSCRYAFISAHLQGRSKTCR